MNFQEQLKKLRGERYKNATDAAKHLTIPYNTYLSYEKGRNPSVENIIKIKEGFNISFELLFGPLLKGIIIDEDYELICGKIRKIIECPEYREKLKDQIRCILRDMEEIKKKEA